MRTSPRSPQSQDPEKHQGGGGYNYNSTEILGFANIHAWIMSGVNIVPVTGEMNPNLGEQHWKSGFSHETEIIEPGYHKVFLDRYKMYLSIANGTTVNVCLSSCMTDTYAPRALHWHFALIRGDTGQRIGFASIVWGGLGGTGMAENLDALNIAVSLLIRAALLAVRFSGRVRKRSLKRLAAMDTDAKAKEILFLKDRVYQVEMQVSILQKRVRKKGKKPRYEVRERLLILWQMEAFQIPR